MEFRELGKTGKKVSEIGLGCEFLDFKPYAQVEETIETALEYGVNIFDVFMPGREVRENIARVFGNRRDKVMIQGHIGATDVNKQYDISRDMPSVQRYFEDLLRIFGGYIDFGMMFFIDSENDYSGVFETEFADYAQKLKAQGKIGHIGFSSHNPAMAARVINTGLPELMLFSINPAFDMTPYDIEAIEKGYEQGLHTGIDPKRAQLYKLCAQKGIGITVMKSLGAGKLLSAEHTPFAKPMSVPQCLHYALSRPAVASVLPGCQTAGQVHEAMRYYSVGGSGRDYTEIISSVRGDFRGSCVYCSHCQPCPAGIDIAAVTKYLDIARLDTANIPPSIRSHYSSLDSRGDACTGCGSCEARCPFGVAIIDNMAQAEQLLG